MRQPWVLCAVCFQKISQVEILHGKAIMFNKKWTHRTCLPMQLVELAPKEAGEDDG